jgi:deferrochelatase/peroxidase EfeB
VIPLLSVESSLTKTVKNSKSFVIAFLNGTVSQHGLFFIAYTKDLDIPEKMLSRMMGTSGDGLHDHLMNYTQAVSGAHFFAPALEMLTSLGSSPRRR